MSRLADILARRLWWAMLWVMRRPWMKFLQLRSWQMWREPLRSRARNSLVTQNRIARRYGLPVLRLSLNLLLASVILTACFMSALRMFESGVLTAPDDVRERALQKGAML